MEELNISLAIETYNNVANAVPELGLTEITVSGIALFIMEMAYTYLLPNSVVQKIPRFLRFIYLITKSVTVINAGIEKMAKTGGGLNNEPEFEIENEENKKTR